MWADRVNDVLYLRPLEDPALSDEQKESQRLEIEWKYELLAAQRADEAIEIYHRTRADAQRMKTVVDRIETQYKQAWDNVAEAQRALEDITAQGERVSTIRSEENNAHKLALKASSQA
jgi:hypothetical protein